MTNQTKALVREFHLKFGHPVADSIETPPSEVRLLRFKLIMEELLEFGRAIGVSGLVEISQAEFEALCKSYVSQQFINPAYEPNLVEAADALGDLDYVVQGSNLVFGFPSEAVLAEIHRANMSKLGADGEPVRDESGKIQKGPNYTPPDVRRVLFGEGPTAEAAVKLVDDPESTTGAPD